MRLIDLKNLQGLTLEKEIRLLKDRQKIPNSFKCKVFLIGKHTQ